MTASTVTASAFGADLLRYRRSASLWLLLLCAPVAARYMISETEGEGVSIAVGGQLPVLTSPVFGIWLGIVVSTLVMPVVFIYLRAGPTRRQPWQLDETSPASRIAIALGRFGADAAIMMGVLIALSLPGLFLAWMKVTGPYQPGHILLLLWVVAGPTLLAVAAIRILFDAVPILRGALGDFLFFMLWMASIIVPSIAAENGSTFANNMASVGGAIRPLMESAPPGSESFAIGTSSLAPGRVELDPWAGIGAQGYLASRAGWVLLSLAIAALAGLVYRPHKSKARTQRFAWLDRLTLRRLLPGAAPSAQRASRAGLGIVSLVLAEMRLIASGPLFPLLAVGAAAIGLADDYRHAGSPAALLLLVFALSSHAGRTEARGLVALTATAPFHPMIRRVAFVIAGTVLSLAIAVPAMMVHGPLHVLELAFLTGAAASLAAIVLAWAARSPFVARITLLIGWYAYLAS